MFLSTFNLKEILFHQIKLIHCKQFIDVIPVVAIQLTETECRRNCLKNCFALFSFIKKANQ